MKLPKLPGWLWLGIAALLVVGIFVASSGGGSEPSSDAPKKTPTATAPKTVMPTTPDDTATSATPAPVTPSAKPSGNPSAPVIEGTPQPQTIKVTPDVELVVSGEFFLTPVYKGAAATPDVTVSVTLAVCPDDGTQTSVDLDWGHSWSRDANRALVNIEIKDASGKVIKTHKPTDGDLALLSQIGLTC
jgi:hypothetical protein